LAHLTRVHAAPPLAETPTSPEISIVTPEGGGGWFRLVQARPTELGWAISGPRNGAGGACVL
jgi:hypothetical protein